MRKALVSLLSFVFCSSLFAQVMTVADFFTLTSLPEKKIHSYISKKGFIQTAQNFDEGSVTQEYFYQEPNGVPVDSATRYLSRITRSKSTGVFYRTSSDSEYTELLKGLKEKGFVRGYDHEDTAVLYQKNDMTVQVDQDTEDALKMYRFRVSRMEMPPAIKYAEDLLAFDSHENLVYVFGKENVKKDAYYFSDNEISKCSVLFPNTSRQAIFLWADQVNSLKLSFLLIGGSLRSESSMNFNRTIPLNAWRCRNGLYTGMPLSELVRMNNSDFDFYGERSEFSFMAVPEKKGNIDFKRTGIVLSCLDCFQAPVISARKVSAEAAAKENLHLYVLSIILVP